MTITQIETQIATYLGRDSVADLTQNGQDIGLYGINSARRRAEQAHDFKLSESNAFLSIGITGGLLSNAFSQANTVGVSVSGTLSPNVVGVFSYVGTYSGNPLYHKVAGGSDYFIASNGSSWAISTDFVNRGSNYFLLTTTSTNPNGTYTAAGTNTGTPVVANASAAVSVKRVKYVSLPLNGGEYEPIEFLTSDEYTSRARKQIGRQHFNPAKNLFQLGVSTLGNPLAYQNGQTLYLAGNNVSFPTVAQLSIVQFLPDYVDNTSSDWLTTYAPEYLIWAGLQEVNRYFKRFTSGRVEGQVSTEDIEAYAQSALDSLISWDIGIVRGTSTPESQGTLPPPAPVGPAQQAA